MKTVPPQKKRGRKKKVPVITKRKESSESSSDDVNNDKGKITINGMVIDIENITDQELYGLRKVLPRDDYR